MQMVDYDIDVALYRTNTVTAHRPEAFSEMDSNCFERIFSAASLTLFIAILVDFEYK